MIAGLAINYDKSEMLTENHNIFFRNPGKILKTVNRVKILGVFITTKYGIDCKTKNKIETINSQATKFTSKNKSFRARAINLETFILFKITYQLRHFTKNKTYMKKLNTKIVDGFWNHKKRNDNQEIVHTERKKGGIGLQNINRLVLVAKLMNLKVFLLGPNNQDNYNEFKKLELVQTN